MTKNKPQVINGFYNYIVKYKKENDVKLNHFFSNDLKDLFERINDWKSSNCVYQDEIIEIKQVMEG